MSDYRTIASMTPGTVFRFGMVTYTLVRVVAGTHRQPRVNQWGRRIGGTYEANKVVVTVDRMHRGVSPAHYVAFPVGTKATVVQ